NNAFCFHFSFPGKCSYFTVLTNNSNAVDCSTTVTWDNSSTRSEYGKNDEAQTVAAKIQHNSVRQKTLLWPGGRIPYTISPSYSESSRSIIQEAFEEYMRQTCIRGRQAVSLGDGCLRKGIAIHELMHVLGFFHEQSRADRDSYVDIHWENVDPTLVDQFDKYSTTIIDELGAPYDYASVMHYAPTAFSKNGQPTITPKAGNKGPSPEAAEPFSTKICSTVAISTTTAAKVAKTTAAAPSVSSIPVISPATTPSAAPSITSTAAASSKTLEPFSFITSSAAAVVPSTVPVSSSVSPTRPGPATTTTTETATTAPISVKTDFNATVSTTSPVNVAVSVAPPISSSLAPAVTTTPSVSSTSSTAAAVTATASAPHTSKINSTVAAPTATARTELASSPASSTAATTTAVPTTTSASAASVSSPISTAATMATITTTTAPSSKRSSADPVTLIATSTQASTKAGSGSAVELNSLTSPVLSSVAVTDLSDLLNLLATSSSSSTAAFEETRATPEASAITPVAGLF
ncbi:unnamed protein product, partial [Gongylonema pulchrum]|uniref:Metalloendopeptidase n=1 Tax=Gongylonema pulchrum TaxID=637853 RepID=A0A183DVY3_9BILA